MEEEKEGSGQPSRSYWANLAGSAATKLTIVAPALTTAKSACASSYGYACHASGVIKDVINVPIQASMNKISSWTPDPENREAILKALAGAGVSATGEALKCFVPGGHPLYRITKAGASGFSKAYSRKGAKEQEEEGSNGVSAAGLAGSLPFEAVEKKLEEMSREMNELKMQNQVLREKERGIYAVNQPPDSLPLLAPEAVPSWQEPEDVIRAFTAKGLTGRDLQSALLIPKFARSNHGASENKT